MSNFVYGAVPKIKYSRSKHDLSHSYSTTFNLGDIVPMDIPIEVYPGDTFIDKTAHVIRTATPFIRNPFGNLFLDFYYFFVPNRLVDDRWVEIMGENTKGAWANLENLSIPHTGLKSGTDVPIGSLADRFGIHGKLCLSDDAGDSEYVSVPVYPFRAYALIYNYFFRDQNNIVPINVNLSNTINRTTESISSAAFDVNSYCGMPAKASRFHDYFSSALPAPQKGEAVDVFASAFPVLTKNSTINSTNAQPLRWKTSSDVQIVSGSLGISTDGRTKSKSDSSFTSSLNDAIPANLWADPSGFSINDLRNAFAIQKMLEIDAIFGSRYSESITAFFGVENPDARLQRPEMLNGKRFPINIVQSVNTTYADVNGNQIETGQVAGNAQSSGVCGYSKSFTEHGFVYCLGVARQHHSYNQGIPSWALRRKRTDMYYPIFSHLGNQPIYTKEIFANINNGNDIFGYKDYGDELRKIPSVITGKLLKDAQEGLDVWTFQDYYENAPVISKAFLEETPAFIDNALSAPSSLIDNFIIDVYHKIDAIRVMPVYGTPGRIDHLQ
ncbi:major capsid protein [Capybara microvirus Cap3_SP_554]|nr:major capsid protein [Capybara microvirus Cap3_SP_554]